jgi:DNA repair photolyase
MEVLADAGVPVGVMVSPVIPGLNDREIPSVLRAARDVGARWACLTALRLPGNVQPIFLAALKRKLPRRAKRVEARIREIHGGELDEARFGKRMTGEGTYWEGIEDLFRVWHRKLGYAADEPETRPRTFRRPGEARQKGLPFEGAAFDIVPPKRYGLGPRAH